ncbi:MAG: Fic family protein [Bifidobacteriaceae bacterium]|jgi:Fic family protein|nr:Fic family protein [Bifidobacteriaceae bacterium]
MEQLTIPKVTYEEYKWEGEIPYDFMNQKDRKMALKPYKAAIVPEIADLDLALNRENQDLILEAVESLARFDALLSQKAIIIPPVLLRSESASSSQIENLTASAKNIAIASIGGKTKDNAALISDNITAMEFAISESKQLNLYTVTFLNELLLRRTFGDQAGLVRNRPVWIGKSYSLPQTAEYVPPHYSRVFPALEDWVKFANREDLHPLFSAAVAHAQFENIHPFIDGNGRTGRALIQVMLKRGGVLRHSTFPVSAGLLHDLPGYIAALSAYREGDFQSIVSRLCQSVLSATLPCAELVTKIEQALILWSDQVHPRKDSVLERLLPLLFVQPVVDAKYVSETLEMSDAGARRLIKQLVDAQILRPIKDQKRNVLYEAPLATGLIDGFAQGFQLRS